MIYNPSQGSGLYLCVGLKPTDIVFLSYSIESWCSASSSDVYLFHHAALLRSLLQGEMVVTITGLRHRRDVVNCAVAQRESTIVVLLDR